MTTIIYILAVIGSFAVLFGLFIGLQYLWYHVDDFVLWPYRRIKDFFFIYSGELDRRLKSFSVEELTLLRDRGIVIKSNPFYKRAMRMLEAELKTRPSEKKE